MTTLDLDAIRAARREAQGEAPVIRFGGHDFVLPSELPFAVAEALANLGEAQKTEDQAAITASLIGAMKAIIGIADWPKFEAARPSMQDITELISGIARLYGLEDAGESPASASS